MYLYRMLLALCTLRPEHRWLLLSHRGLHGLHADLFGRPGVELHIERGLLARSGPLWLQLGLPARLRGLKPDLYWGSLGILPLGWRRRAPCPAAVNFHDLNALVAPQTMVPWNRWQHRLLDGASLHNATSVLCLSETTRRDIVSFYPQIDPRKLRVVYPGCELAAQARPPSARERFSGLKRPFFLCVGTIEPRKNHQTLIDAYRTLRAERGDSAPWLVIAGRRGWGKQSIYQQLISENSEESGLLFLENPDDAELAWCYQNALALTLPSLHEGFGLPVIEAMQHGCPALLSDIPIFREIAPKANFAPATSASAWAEAMARFIAQAAAGRLHRPAIDQEEWSWKNRAALLATILDETAAAKERQ